MSLPLRYWSALGLATLAAGCATSAYHRAGNGDDVAQALGRARADATDNRPLNAGGRPLAFLAFGGIGGGRLAAYDLAASKLLWIQPAELTSRVEVGRDAIVHAAKGGQLVGRDIETGAPLWQHAIASEERLLGYAVDGQVAIYVVSTRDGTRFGRGTAVGLDARTGSVRWRHDLPSGDVGGPAARGGVVAVPVQSQYVILLDGNDGDQLAQILSSEEAATYVRGMPEGIVFGSKGIFLASPATATGSRTSPGYLRANLPKFVRPFYHFDMYRPEQTDYSAIDRNRILWRIDADAAGKASFKEGMVFVHNYRFFFGFDAHSGGLKWAYNQAASDAVSSDDAGSALVFVTADGELGALDAASGARIYTARVPGVTMVRGATFDTNGFHPTGGAGGAGELMPVRGGGDLASTLSTIVWDPDRRFWDVKVFAIEELGKLPGRAVTADLLKVTQQPDIPPAVAVKAGEALAARKDPGAADLFIQTLKVHGDYVEGKRATSVEIIARAAAAMSDEKSDTKPGSKPAAPPAKELAAALAEHLRLPETEPAAVVAISKALVALKAVEALPALRDFISIYRADPASDGDPAAVIAVAEALVRLGGRSDRELLLYLAEEPRTVGPLRLHIRRALAQTAVTAE